jgi:fucose 4-O-acetylase-like acetyltransferase
VVDEERCHQQVALGTVGRDKQGDQARGVAVLLVVLGAEPRPDREGAVVLIVA